MQMKAVALRMVGLGGIVLCAAGVAAAQTSIFRSAPTYSLNGDATRLLAIADVGAPPIGGTPDGLPDVITVTQNFDVVILFGNRNGTFSSGPSIPVPDLPTAMAAADIDGDGFVDLLISLPGILKDTVVFMHGDRNGPPFDAPGPPIAVGHGSVAIGIADVDGDHKLDAVVLDDGGGTSGEVSILLGDGHGGFTPGTTIPTGVGSRALVLADFNHDNKMDIAVVNAGLNNAVILKGDGMGGFVQIDQPSTGEEPVAIAATDLDKNGQLDLVVVNGSADSVSVLDGNGDGTFKAARFFPSGSAGSTPSGLALADLNLDGNTDVVVSNDRTNDVSVLLGDGRGSLSAPRAFVADQDVVAVASGDFNDDDVPDVLTLDLGSSVPNVAVLLGLGDGSLTAVEDVIARSTPSGLVTGDVDNDGIADLLVAQSDGTVLVYRADPQGGFAAPLILQSGGDAVAVGAGDFNGDGRLDVVAVNRSTMNVSVFLARANGGFADAQDYAAGAGAAAVEVGDWNGDGLSDLAVLLAGAGSPAGVIPLLAQPNGTFSAGAQRNVGAGPVAIDSGDFNKDGKRDLVVADNGAKDLSILLGTGDGGFQSAISVPVGSGPRAVAVADFDRDGADDIAVAFPVSGISGNVTVYYGNGQGGLLQEPRVSP